MNVLTLKILGRKIIGDVNFGYIVSKIKTPKFLAKYYIKGSSVASNKGTIIIYMADGHLHHGGLADRLRGMVSLFHYASIYNKQYRINFLSPFSLDLFLEPNLYDWKISPNDISYNSECSIPLCIPNSLKKQKELADRLLRNKEKYKQVHVYTNMAYDFKKFGYYFNRLFKPTARLQELLDFNVKKIGGNYISVTFRFQQLLGDFKEGNFPILSDLEQKELIEKSLQIIPKIKAKHKDVNKILVTADSIRFLDLVRSHIEDAYTIPGEIAHIDFTQENDIMYIKSFVDFFMISRAEKIYLASSGLMYSESGFAMTASLINNVPYEKVEY